MLVVIGHFPPSKYPGVKDIFLMTPDRWLAVVAVSSELLTPGDPEHPPHSGAGRHPPPPRQPAPQPTRLQPRALWNVGLTRINTEQPPEVHNSQIQFSDSFCVQVYLQKYYLQSSWVRDRQDRQEIGKIPQTNNVVIFLTYALNIAAPTIFLKNWLAKGDWWSS